MKTFIDSSNGQPYSFDDNVTATADANGTLTFTYTTGAREPDVYGPDVVVPAIYAPDTVDESGAIVPGELVAAASTTQGPFISQGALIAYPLSDVPATLKAATDAEFSAAQQPSAAKILADNTITQQHLLSQASSAMGPLQLAITLGEATDAETALAKLLVSYVRTLKAVDLTAASVSWPVAPN